jgi:hypothetical protein
LNNQEPRQLTLLEDSSDEEMAKALEQLDLTLPQEFLDESMAIELLENIVNVYKSESASKAAQYQGNTEAAEALTKQAAMSRSAAGLIQLKYPGAQPLIQDIAKVRVAQIRQSRKQLAESLLEN